MLLPVPFFSPLAVVVVVVAALTMMFALLKSATKSVSGVNLLMPLVIVLVSRPFFWFRSKLVPFTVADPFNRW